jgi:hypothetical protein
MLLPRSFFLGANQVDVPDELRDPPFASVHGVLEREGNVIVFFAEELAPEPEAIVQGSPGRIQTVATAAMTRECFHDSPG